MKKTTIISLIAIALIFLYWRSKKGRIGNVCASLWDDMSNSRAEEIFINKMSEIDNNHDLREELTLQYAKSGYDYGKCVYTANSMLKAKEQGGWMEVLPYEWQILSSTEVSKIKDCVCEKLKDQ